MSSDLSRRSFGIAALATLAGCGFAPAFGTGGTATKLRNKVDVTAPDTPFGFTMRQRVADRLGATSAPRYTLALEVSQDTEAAAVTTDGDTTRFQIAATAAWMLSDTAGTMLARGTAQSFTSYAATGSTVATQAAAKDAADRLAIILSDQIVADLTIQAGSLP